MVNTALTDREATALQLTVSIIAQAAAVPSRALAQIVLPALSACAFQLRGGGKGLSSGDRANHVRMKPSF